MHNNAQFIIAKLWGGYGIGCGQHFDSVVDYSSYMEQSKKRIALDSLYDIDVHMHPITGARLKLANKTSPFIDEEGNKFASPFFVFWAPADQKTITQYELTADFAAATSAYKQMKKDNAPPKEFPFSRDYQEDKIVEFNTWVSRGSAKYNLPQMQNLTAQIVADFNMAAVDTDYKPDSEDNKLLGYAITSLNEIMMRTRDMSILLHEMAHIIDTHVCGNDGINHGPSFMRVYMTLLSRYMHFPIFQLEEKAQKLGIDVADINDLRTFKKRLQNYSPYPA